MSPLSEKVLVVLITAPKGRKAQTLAKGLVAARLAACVNVVPGLISHYRWQGRLHRDPECLLVVKTTRKKVAQLKGWIKTHHPYSNAELICLSVVDGSADYLRWVAAQVS
ncbi:MAG: divalent-cation tolerance protein CutA [Elusimicrobiota bacterium]